ncbi:gene 25-like lysozyme [Chitinophaga skermanii]|uniref:Gene 25-like lysozyme n=1 Tax=Chitinophaga skermanii TaxID=331697 RepID=A0A327Q7K0_9BACT|nr:GPW/gp25 family protein [Chitinophaga skermanii]RAJ00479.1 gene 25-like lysozyme [Chitinophaga skermanii]
MRSEFISPLLGLSTKGPGTLVDGINTIRQCIYLILTTSKRSDPFRPQFGCDAKNYLDLPVVEAVPKMKNAILESLTIWENRISVQRITHVIRDFSKLEFSITYCVNDLSIVDTIVFSLSGKNSLTYIIYSIIPENADRLTFELEIDGKITSPVPSASGFSSSTELFTYLKESFYYLGQWHLLSDRILLHISEYHADIRFSISPLLKKVFKIKLPEISDSNTVLQISIKTEHEYNYRFSTYSALLNWLNNTMHDLGTWLLESAEINTASFSDKEFSEEFSTNEVQVQTYLVGAINFDIENIEIQVTEINA